MSLGGNVLNLMLLQKYVIIQKQTFRKISFLVKNFSTNWFLRFKPLYTTMLAVSCKEQLQTWYYIQITEILNNPDLPLERKMMQIKMTTQMMEQLLGCYNCIHTHLANSVKQINSSNEFVFFTIENFIICVSFCILLFVSFYVGLRKGIPEKNNGFIFKTIYM